MEWIKISERRPKYDVKVLVLFEKSMHVEDAELFETENDGWGYVLFDGDMINDRPTHWMPFPELVMR